ncbi:MAG: hypothetical protein AAGD05_14920 [Bacteroidota bacterium]
MVCSSGLLWLTACTYDSEEILFPPASCDTIAVSYQQRVLPILETNCYRCHDTANAQGGIQLEAYPDLRELALIGSLLGAIRHEEGFSPMPQEAPKLSECTIETIAAWVNQGALDN